ncbi:MAG: CDP-glycerol glycerophosphotransferase family protein, partial [Chlamydiia bacterium]|nr:CDP-glycerol glycerophosphotransferase family protein [Chlamydiia bacterium]
MNSPRIATIISDQDFQYVDHLAPLSSLLSIPLLVTDERIEKLINAYYPEVQTILLLPIELPQYLVTQFEIVITCLPTPLFRKMVYAAELFHGKGIVNVWCPHGNSDKGYLSSYMEELREERVALVYGEKMIHFLLEKGSYHQLEKVCVTGNYRYRYYLQNKPFLDQHFLALIPNEKRSTILYAPTWSDDENNSSFSSASQQLIECVPDEFHIIIKLHPNIFASPEILEAYQLVNSKKKNVTILPEFPPIYPILNHVEYYLGDMSSIGYDFLTFRKPMFFLNPNKRDPIKDRGLYLTRCGTVINPEQYDKIFSLINERGDSRFTE